MSLHMVAGLDFPSCSPAAATPCFLLGVDSAGRSVMRETTGRRAGLFRTREAAIKYAREECGGGSFTVIDRIGALELDARSV